MSIIRADVFAEADVGVWYAVNVALTFSLVFGFLPAGMLAQGYVQIGARSSGCDYSDCSGIVICVKLTYICT